MTDIIDWDQAYKEGRDYATLGASSLTFIIEKLDKESPNTALDIGCGTGQVCRDLFHRKFDAVGIDISQEAIKQAKESSGYIGRGINFSQCNAETESLPRGKYGLIICKDTYAFFKDKNAFLKSVLNIMHPNGMFVIISPSADQMPLAKKHITVDHAKTMKMLGTFFSKIDHTTRGSGEFYLCQL